MNTKTFFFFFRESGERGGEEGEWERRGIKRKGGRERRKVREFSFLEIKNTTSNYLPQCRGDLHFYA